MLSILIPVFNFDIRELVYEIVNQSKACKIDFEILCFDDGSLANFRKINKEILNVKNVEYKELPKNIGRSKIRNLLATEARYEYLLFLDCDSKVNRPDFIAAYLRHAKPEYILCGGRDYEINPPQNPDYMLRWLYGIQRETLSVTVRQKNPYKSFMTNNVWIPRTLFLAIRFDENIIGYGHEDTLFGNAVRIKQDTVCHIVNPLTHIGLEPASEFIQKTEEGLMNLKAILKQQIQIGNVQILNYYKILTQLRLNLPVVWCFKLFKIPLRANLMSRKPNLIIFDLYKLGFLLTLKD